MTIAPSQIGIDIAKGWLDIYDATTRRSQRITNASADITMFLMAHATARQPRAVVLKAGRTCARRRLGLEHDEHGCRMIKSDTDLNTVAGQCRLTSLEVVSGNA
jgi:hypothetical protein